MYPYKKEAKNINNEKNENKDSAEIKQCVYQKAFLQICQIMSFVTSSVMHSENIQRRSKIKSNFKTICIIH